MEMDPFWEETSPVKIDSIDVSDELSMRVVIELSETKISLIEILDREILLT